MVTARVLEERLIRMQRQGEGYFWIGGPGEEAFNTALGLLVKKGQGLDHDYLHLHYRSSATVLGPVTRRWRGCATSAAPLLSGSSRSPVRVSPSSSSPSSAGAASASSFPPLSAQLPFWIGCRADHHLQILRSHPMSGVDKA